MIEQKNVLEQLDSQLLKLNEHIMIILRKDKISKEELLVLNEMTSLFLRIAGTQLSYKKISEETKK